MIKTEESHRLMSDRYEFDFKVCTPAKGFAQFDTTQDASYYGIWCNPHLFKMISYCEGDVTEQTCETAEEFVQMVREAVAWHGERFLGIDPGFKQALKERFFELGLDDLLH